MVLVKGEVRLPKGEVRTKLPMGSGQIDGTERVSSSLVLAKLVELVREGQQGLGLGVHLEGAADGDLGFRDRQLADRQRFGETPAATGGLGCAQDEAHLSLAVSGLGRLSFQPIEHRYPLGENGSLGLILSDREGRAGQ